MGRPINDKSRITPEEAARMLKVSTDVFRYQLSIGVYEKEVGSAVLLPGHKNKTYTVYRRGVEELAKRLGTI